MLCILLNFSCSYSMLYIFPFPKLPTAASASTTHYFHHSHTSICYSPYYNPFLQGLKTSRWQKARSETNRWVTSARVKMSREPEDNREEEIESSHMTREGKRRRAEWDTKTVDGRRMKERASLAGASGRLRLFNALINPLLKAMQRVSGFVLWPRDYLAINEG